jgi:hypothetical protein
LPYGVRLDFLAEDSKKRDAFFADFLSVIPIKG